MNTTLKDGERYKDRPQIAKCIKEEVARKAYKILELEDKETKSN